jgi:hypothetical protein
MNKNLYQTGDIIQCVSSNYPVKHYGIVVNEDGVCSVIHNVPDIYNCFGGNTIIWSIEDFLSENSEHVVVGNTHETLEQIAERYEQIKFKEYNKYTFNCEHWVYNHSWQVNEYVKWGLIGFTVLLTGISIYYGIKRYKNS